MSGKNIFWSTLITKVRGKIFLNCYNVTCTMKSSLNGLLANAISQVAPTDNVRIQNFSSLAFSYWSRPKCIFSRYMFCLYHFLARIHSVFTMRAHYEKQCMKHMNASISNTVLTRYIVALSFLTFVFFVRLYLSCLYFINLKGSRNYLSWATMFQGLLCIV